MTPHQPDRSVSRRTALASLGALAAALSIARQLDAAAQEATPEATPIPRDGHPIVGVWQSDPDPGNPHNTLPINIHASNGAYVEYGVGFAEMDRPTVGIGAWRPTGERTAEVVFVDQSMVDLASMLVLDQPLPANLLEGNAPRIRRSVEVDEGGNRFTGVQYWIDENGEDIGATYTAIGSYRLVAAPGV